MHPPVAPLNDAGWNQFGKPFEPQACGFCFRMPKLPGLDYLVRLPQLSTEYPYWIFQANPGAR